MELLDHGAFLASMAERCGGGDATPGRLLSLSSSAVARWGWREQ
jgi:hypothetical protein